MDRKQTHGQENTQTTNNQNNTHHNTSPTSNKNEAKTTRHVGMLKSTSDTSNI